MAAPAPTQPKWINPCGMNKQEVEHVEQELEYLMPAVTQTELIQHIVTQSMNALSHAEQFREEYVRRTFNVAYDEHHKSWKTYKYDWLPNIPKELGEKVPDEHLKKQTLNDSLRDIYQYLQKYAVGLEQIVWDQKDDNADFSKNFEDVEFKLRSVLCEVQVAMAEQGVMQFPDVKRDIMASEFRDMKYNASYRNLRDWIILRDYMNGLEYVVQQLEYFNKPANQA